MPLFLSILLAVLGLVALALWWPVYVGVEAELLGLDRAELRLQLRFFSGLIRLKLCFSFHILKAPTLRLYRISKKGRKELWALGQPQKKPEKALGKNGVPISEIWAHTRVKRLHVSGELGVRDDAFFTVMLAGALTNALTMTALALLKDKSDPPPDCFIHPNFEEDRLRLKLEGIAGCPPIHIISAIVLWNWKNRKGQKTVWNTQSKTL